MTELPPYPDTMHANDPPRRASAEGPTWPGLTTAQSLAVASQFGITLAVAVALGVFAGQWLDGLMRTGIVLTLIGALVGFVAEVASAITLYRATLRRSLLEWRDQPKRRGPLTSSQSGWQSATPASPSRQGTNEAGVRTGTAQARRAPWS